MKRFHGERLATPASEDLALFTRVQDALRFPYGEGLSLADWCNRITSSSRLEARGRRRRAALAILNVEGWPGIRLADRILRGLPRFEEKGETSP